MLVVLLLAALGATGSSGPTSESLGRTDTVLVVSVPGLRWQDLVATETPALDRLLVASGLMSVRAMGPETSPLEGYLTIGAGNRLEADGVDATLVDGRCVPGVLDAARASADDDLNGAEPGALGERLRVLGVATTVYGRPQAIAALMASDGCVDAFAADVAGAAGSLEPGVTLIELGGLDRTDVAVERAAALATIDATVGDLEVPADALVLVVAPSAPFDRAEVTVAGARPPSAETADTADTPDTVGTATAPASLVSPTTRRADYVTLPDVAPAILAALGDPADDLPDSMNGTELRRTSSDAADRAAHESDLADLAERVIQRDRAVGPVSVVLVVLIVLCAFAAIGRRDRTARMLAPIVVAYPTIAFASGLVAYHQLPLNFVVVIIPVLAAVLASVAVSVCSRWGAWAPVGALGALLWAVLVIDICTGGHLQINTPLGYTPTVAGRFQGFGNLSFGLVGAAAVVTAVLAMHTRPGARHGSPARHVEPAVAAGVTAFVGAVTVVAVAAPAFGSDVGGTLAIVPTFALMVPMVLGRRIGWRPVLLVGVGTVAAVAGLAALDLARPAESRTHLGRFLDELLHGDGGLVIRRKMRGNLAILTSSFWSFVLIGVLLAVAVFAWRHRQVVAPAIGSRPALRVFLAGFAVVAVLGFALNDSGLAVPAIMLAVAVPWIVASVVPVVKRAGR